MPAADERAGDRGAHRARLCEHDRRPRAVHEVTCRFVLHSVWRSPAPRQRAARTSEADRELQLYRELKATNRSREQPGNMESKQDVP